MAASPQRLTKKSYFQTIYHPLWLANHEKKTRNPRAQQIEHGKYMMKAWASLQESSKWVERFWMAYF